LHGEEGEKRQAALEGLRHVRDVLLRKEFLDEERLSDGPKPSASSSTPTHVPEDLSVSVPNSKPTSLTPSAEAQQPSSSNSSTAKGDSSSERMSRSTILPAVESPSVRDPLSVGKPSPSNSDRNGPWSYSKSEFSGNRHGLPSATLPRSTHSPYVAAQKPKTNTLSDRHAKKEPLTSSKASQTQTQRATSPFGINDPLGVT
jgi:hypothetical protein